MKYLIASCILLLIIPIAAALNYNEYDEVVMDVNISSYFEVMPKGDDYTIDYVDAYVSFYPRESAFQEVSGLDLNPDAEIKDEKAYFRFMDPDAERYDFEIFSRVKVNKGYPKVRGKVDFPLRSVPVDVAEYTKATQNINSDDPDVQMLASELASGEEDLFVVSHNVARWIEENIDYSLDTLTAESSQSAVWVLKNKKGVCDELTTLFAAMMRSLGVPVRFVSGLAYTNVGEQGWGPHAWAEVYYPGYGWVPFDISYQQFGYVDPSHIVLKYSLDSDESSSNYEWKSYKCEIDTNKLDLTVDEISKNRDDREYTALGVDVLKDETDIGSYNIVEVEIENLNDYYYPAVIYLGHTNDVNIFGETKQNVLLAPNQVKKLYWKIKVSDDLDDDYIYTIPSVAFTSENQTARADFKVSRDFPFYSNEVISETLEFRQEVEEKVYSNEVSIECLQARDSYEYENASLDCEVSNEGNTLIKDLDVCIGDDCSTLDIAISRSKRVSFILTKDEPGTHTYVVRAENKDLSRAESFDVDILDRPDIEISDLDYPESVRFKEEFNITFNVDKASMSNPKNLKVRITSETAENEWLIDDMKADETFQLGVVGKFLNIGENNFTIDVEYHDLNGRSYEESSDFVIRLDKVNIFQRIYIALNKAGRWLCSLF